MSDINSTHLNTHDATKTAASDALDPIQKSLLNDYQKQFPRNLRPFLNIAQAFRLKYSIEISEEEVIYRLKQLKTGGFISRIGPVFRPNILGKSTLAAIKVPETYVTECVEYLNALKEVNHNYYREHAYNIWFVLTASDNLHLERLIRKIECDLNLPILNLPLLKEFHIDLGFDLWKNSEKIEENPNSSTTLRQPALCLEKRTKNYEFSFQKKILEFENPGPQQNFLKLLQDGLEICPQPFLHLAQKLNIYSDYNFSETACLNLLQETLESGLIKRFGIVVRHHELGYKNNAMIVCDIPDENLANFAVRLAAYQAINLCYQRPRRFPDWPYNLFCMIHGKDRASIAQTWQQILKNENLEKISFEILFSTRRFKQNGARYF